MVLVVHTNTSPPTTFNPTLENNENNNTSSTADAPSTGRGYKKTLKTTGSWHERTTVSGQQESIQNGEKGGKHGHNGQDSGRGDDLWISLCPDISPFILADRWFVCRLYFIHTQLNIHFHLLRLIYPLPPFLSPSLTLHRSLLCIYSLINLITDCIYT